MKTLRSFIAILLAFLTFSTAIVFSSSKMLPASAATALGTFDITSPTNGQSKEVGRITITWSAVANATNYVINVRRINADGSDGELVVNGANTSGTQYSTSLLTEGYSYRIGIRAEASGYSPSYASPVTFRVVKAAVSTALSNKVIVAFGDSLTANGDWTKTLSERFGTNVINSGVAGNNTTHGLARFDTAVKAYNPDIVLVEFGMNDSAIPMSGSSPAVSLAQYESNLLSIYNKCVQLGSTVIFVTPNVIIESKYYERHPASAYASYGGAQAFCDIYTDVMRKLAISKNCAFVDVRAECSFLDSITEIVDPNDGVHPHAAGFDLYALWIGNYLEAKYINTSKLASTEVRYTFNNTSIATPIRIYGAIGAAVSFSAPTFDNYILSGDAEVYVQLSSSSEQKHIFKYLKELGYPDFIYPTDNSTVPCAELTISWVAVEHAEKYRFSLRDLTSDTLLYSSITVYSSNYAVPAEKLSAGHEYRVAVFSDATGYQGKWRECVFSLSDLVTDLKLKTGSKLNIKDGKYLTGVAANTSVSDIISQFNNTGVVVVLQNGNTAASGTKVGTGMRVRLYNGNVILDELSVIIKGDCDGDGAITTTDFIRVKRTFQNQLTLSTVELLAANVDDSDNVITVTDFLRIKRHFQKTFDIYS